MLTSRDRFERRRWSPLQLRQFLRNKQHTDTAARCEHTLQTHMPVRQASLQTQQQTTAPPKPRRSFTRRLGVLVNGYAYLTYFDLVPRRCSSTQRQLLQESSPCSSILNGTSSVLYGKIQQSTVFF